MQTFRGDNCGAKAAAQNMEAIRTMIGRNFTPENQAPKTVHKVRSVMTSLAGSI